MSEEEDKKIFKAVLKEQDGVVIQPTADDIKNGWTEETLTAYHAEQNASAAVRIARGKPKGPPRRTNNKYNPFRWRG